MKIKIKYTNPNTNHKISIHGDWIDCKAAKTYNFKGMYVNSNGNVVTDFQVIDLGIAMELPKGFEGIMSARSGLYKEKFIMQTNGIGVEDNSYCGNGDIWKFPAVNISFKDNIIEEGDRICQFRIQPNQFAPWYVKLKWLFTSKIEFQEVDILNNNNRGGLGSTGLK